MNSNVSILNKGIKLHYMKTWRVEKSEMQDNFNNFQEKLEKCGSNMYDIANLKEVHS